jgi:hypothetical protein
VERKHPNVPHRYLALARVPLGLLQFGDRLAFQPSVGYGLEVRVLPGSPLVSPLAQIHLILGSVNSGISSPRMNGLRAIRLDGFWASLFRELIRTLTHMSDLRLGLNGSK